MNVTRRRIWSAAFPRHHFTHGCIAERFAAETGLGVVPWMVRGGVGPFQFHVSGGRDTYEMERSEDGGRHRFDVSVLECVG